MLKYKKGWNKPVTMFFIFLAIVIAFVMAMYSLSEFKSISITDSTFYNTSKLGIENLDTLSGVLKVFAFIVGLVLVLYVIIKLKESTGMGVR